MANVSRTARRAQDNLLSRTGTRVAKARTLVPQVRVQAALQRVTAPQLNVQPSDVLALQQTVGNRNVQRLLVQRDKEDQAAAGGQKDLPSVTGYVGLNPGAWKEAEALKKSAAGQVITSLDSPAAEKGFDTVEKRIAWVMNVLGINPLLELKRFQRVWKALEGADPGFREQMGDLMRLFAGAEAGQYRLERLVMSGHSNGVQLWGDKDATRNPGTFFIERDFTNLVGAFPKAAAQVEDIMFSACFSIGAIILCQKLFPNLKSAWAYSGFSPSVKQGSGRHVSKFERTTTGAKTPAARAKMGSSAIWTREKGFVAGDPGKAAISNLVNQLNARVDDVHKMMIGDAPLNQTVLRQYYTIIQQLIVHPECESQLRKKAEWIRDRVLRLRFWEQICQKFVTAYKSEMEVAYKEIGLKQPDLKNISRAGLKAHLIAYDKALKDKPSSKAQQFYDNRLKKGLWDLDPSAIPSDWV
ncbi:MAG: hypothetical protein ACWGPS_09450 [Candidatus Promineifilaceae bacterium]